MDEIKLPELICGYLNGSGAGVKFVPEAWREGCASVWLTGGGEKLREYVDGSYVAGIPFEIRIRCAGRTIGDRLDAVEFFAGVAEYVKTVPLGEIAGGKIEVTGGASKASVFENGEEEYRASYRLSFYQMGGN